MSLLSVESAHTNRSTMINIIDGKKKRKEERSRQSILRDLIMFGDAHTKATEKRQKIYFNWDVASYTQQLRRRGRKSKSTVRKRFSFPAAQYWKEEKNNFAWSSLLWWKIQRCFDYAAAWYPAMRKRSRSFMFDSLYSISIFLMKFKTSNISIIIIYFSWKNIYSWWQSTQERSRSLAREK